MRAIKSLDQNSKDEPASTPRRRQRRLGRTATLALVTVGLVASLLGVGASRADAYYVSKARGQTGAVVAPPVNVWSGYQVVVPNVTVSRNGAVARGGPQMVKVIAQLQYWNGSTWVMVDELASLDYIQELNSSVTVDLGLMKPRYNVSARAGYYRVVYGVQWGSTWNPFNQMYETGFRMFEPNAIGEMNCQVTTCTRYAGYAYVRG